MKVAALGMFEYEKFKMRKCFDGIFAFYNYNNLVMVTLLIKTSQLCKPNSSIYGFQCFKDSFMASLS